MAFPDGWTRRWKVTSDHTLVPTDQLGSKLLFSSASLPAAIFTYAKDDGSDVRITTDLNGASQIPVEVVHFSGINSQAEIWAYGDLHSAANDDFYVWAGNPFATLPLFTDTYGRNNVWPSGVFTHHFQETSGNYINSTGDTTYDGTVSGVTRGVTGAFSDNGFGASFPVANNAKVTLGGNALPVSTHRTFTAWINLTGFGGNGLGRIISQESNLLVGSGVCARANGTGGIRYFSQPTNTESAANAFATGSWIMVGITLSAASPALLNIYINGVLSGTADQSTTLVSAVNSVIGGADAVNTRNYDGLIDEIRVTDQINAANAQLTMYRIQGQTGLMFPTIVEVPLSIEGHSCFRGIGRGIGRGIM
jgi:hypothetical protein